MAKDTVSIKLKGVEEAVKEIEKYFKKNKGGVEKILKTTAGKIMSDAKLGTPVMYGKLRNSITANWSGSGKDFSNIEGVGKVDSKPGEFIAAVGTNVKYAHMQEYGTWGDAPKPGKGEYPSKRGHESIPRPPEGFLFLTKAYEHFKDEPVKEIDRQFKK